MNRKSRMLWLVSSLAIAAIVPTALAAQNGHKAVKQHLKAAQKNQFATSPRTMAQADTALVRLPSGVMAQPVATELWSHLAVQKDAQGKLHQVETSSDVAPTGTYEGDANE